MNLKERRAGRNFVRERVASKRELERQKWESERVRERYSSLRGRERERREKFCQFPEPSGSKPGS